MQQRQGAARPRPPAACQRGPPCTDGGVAPLHGGRMDPPVPWRPASKRRHPCRGALAPTACRVDHALALVALDALGDQALAPPQPSGASACARGDGSAPRLPHGPEGGHHALGTAPPGTPCRPAPPPRPPAPHPGPVALRADRAAPPHAGLAPQGQGPPHEAALGLHAALLGLARPQGTRGLDQRRLPGLALVPATCHPIGSRPRIRAQRDDERVEGAPRGPARSPRGAPSPQRGAGARSPGLAWRGTAWGTPCPESACPGARGGPWCPGRFGRWRGTP